MLLNTYIRHRSVWSLGVGRSVECICQRMPKPIIRPILFIRQASTRLYTPPHASFSLFLSLLIERARTPSKPGSPSSLSAPPRRCGLSAQPFLRAYLRLLTWYRVFNLSISLARSRAAPDQNQQASEARMPTSTRRSRQPPPIRLSVTVRWVDTYLPTLPI
ncbi:hypothetical protein LX32DRAFT_279345 [Colletotrichum zoysiae]|uniref:Uncharacterized protein n=1 Tax=Colletotrichum zoysiae TaxID=1216348 RepID=A0AAD9M478_9PEZI|nr:hypothetical protein LX32DRAFT_279345 [Colletotrichum zoysiae]